MISKLTQHWFLIGLIVILVLGITWSPSLDAASERVPRNAIVAMVLFLMAIPLQFRVFWSVIKSPWMVLLATLLNYGLVPPMAWLLAKALPTHGFAEGVIIASAVPCTMASAAVWTRRAGGNDAIALFVTMITSVSCFVATPWIIATFIGTKIEISDIDKMMSRLFLLVVLPIIVAQLSRSIPLVATWSTRCKKQLSIAAQLGLLAIVFVGAVRSGEELRKVGFEAVSLRSWFTMIFGVIAIHVVVLLVGKVLALRFGGTREDSIAVAFAGSQKTLMVGLDLSIQNSAMFGGLAAIPMVVYHVGQLFVDTIFAERWRKAEEAKSTPPDEPRENS